jgi:hypothetical protein
MVCLLWRQRKSYLSTIKSINNGSVRSSRFVNNLLLLRSRVDLHTFQLHCESECWHLLNCNDLRTWIGYSVKQNVKVLDVY